jgi:hypothetical protein
MKFNALFSILFEIPVMECQCTQQRIHNNSGITSNERLPLKPLFLGPSRAIVRGRPKKRR